MSTANRFRPGPGWKNLGSAVWEHDCGVRIHTHGLCGFPVEPIIDGTLWPEWKNLRRMIAINGGNQKRGVIAWALEVFREGRLFKKVSA